jgi:3-oxoacyl-[acyl-carrier-protein] synthase III
VILRFAGKKISSLVTVLPQTETRFEDELENYNFPPDKSLRLKRVMGFDRHRTVTQDVCASDLCLFGVHHLVEKGVLNLEEVGALVFVTQSPDYFIPPTSNVIQGKLGLGKDVFCLDINQGCAGFVIGLMQAFMLLELGPIRKVLLLNGDTLSRRVSRRDRNIYPMIGDAGSVAVIENEPDRTPITGFLEMDGSRCNGLMIPAGGFRNPSDEATRIETEVGDGNYRSREQFYMDGASVFNFVQTDVPPMIRAVLAAADESDDKIDFFLFHQPNKFMVDKLASAMCIPSSRIPNNIVENFGNASSVTIPTNITYNLGELVLQRKLRVCLAGFGVGLTLSALVMNLGTMRCCDLVNYAASKDPADPSQVAKSKELQYVQE